MFTFSKPATEPIFIGPAACKQSLSILELQVDPHQLEDMSHDSKQSKSSWCGQVHGHRIVGDVQGDGISAALLSESGHPTYLYFALWMSTCVLTSIDFILC